MKQQKIMKTHPIDQAQTNLNDQVSHLTEQVEKLTERLAAVEKKQLELVSNYTADSYQPTRDIEMPSFEIMSKVGKSSFLPKVSSVCFILVIALVLRTLTDGGMVSHHVGSFLGVGYAAILIGMGWRLLTQESKIAVVFPISGALLMYSIVLETHTRFAPFTSVTAYIVLFLTLITLVITGKRFEKSSFHGVGLLGATIAAFIIDFPRPEFYQLAFFVYAANVTAYYFSELPRIRWVQVTLYVMSMLFWLLWTSKIHSPMSKGFDVVEGVSITWFLPLTLLFAVTLMRFAFQRSFRKGHSVSIFDIILPTINVILAYCACWAVVNPWLGHIRWVGLAGVLFALIHYGAAWIISKFSHEGGPGICAFTFAGSTLLLVATPSAVGNMLIALPFLSAIALGLLMTSYSCEIGGVRLASYLMQSTTCGMAISYGLFSTSSAPSIAGFIVAASLVLTSGAHYFWSRKRPLTCSSGYFHSIDPSDRIAVFLLIAALINGFAMMQMGGYYILASFTDSLNNALLGLQSVLINCGAMALMLMGLKGKHKEILYAAIIVAVIGAFKVFGFDLFKASGVPLVISVFSFGGVAAVASVVMGKWPQTQKT